MQLLKMVQGCCVWTLIRVQKLIKAGADVNIRDFTGNTALIHIISGTEPRRVMNNQMDRRLSCVKLLITAGADVNITNDSGLNALYVHLVKEPDEQVVMLLFTAGTKTSGVSKVRYCMREPEGLELRHICRTRIRNHLLELDSQSHLFGRIPHLGLPGPLMRYLLYYMSLGEED